MPVQVDCGAYRLADSVYNGSCTVGDVKKDLVQENTNLAGFAATELQLALHSSKPLRDVVRLRSLAPAKSFLLSKRLPVVHFRVILSKAEKVIPLPDVPPEFARIFKQNRGQAVDALVKLTGFDQELIEGLLAESGRRRTNDTTNVQHFYQLLRETGYDHRRLLAEESPKDSQPVPKKECVLYEHS